MASPHYDWVEILEPETNKIMYANVTTGDCRWMLPSDVPVKKNHSNQWWELFDGNTGRPYYYNANSQATIWEKPADGDIIGLAKLQKMQEEMARQEALEAEARTARAASISTPPSSSQPTPPTKAYSNGVGSAAPAVVASAGPSGATGGGDRRAGSMAAATKTTSSSSPQSSAPTPPAPPPKPSDAALEGFQEINQARKGLFRKKVSIATMLAWSKEPLPVPMLLTLVKKNKKEALDMFKLVQTYMGDRACKGREVDDVCLDIIARTWVTPTLRDELFLQLCKQTTQNSSLPSCQKGWELLVIALSFFPPSKKFLSYLTGYVSKHTGSVLPGQINTFALHCMKKLERIQGSKRGVAPTLEEIQHARHEVFHPSVFGNTLEDVMAIQASSQPDYPLPWVLVTLVQAVLSSNGVQTEGLFRVPGDIDSVNILKVHLDKSEPPPPFSDPHIPASTLKLWFRELYEPLIPTELYDRCIAASDSSALSLAVVDSLPPLNRLVLLYIVRFLQIVGTPENQKFTKMNYDNLSMVWAPNFLRCPSDDPLVLFQNTKKELSFVRNLVLDLNTKSIIELGLGLQ